MAALARVDAADGTSWRGQQGRPIRDHGNLDLHIDTMLPVTSLPKVR